MEFCNNCQNNYPISNFYIYSSGVLYKKCIACHNSSRTKIKKKTGFQKLDLQIQDKIRADFGRNISLKSISEKYSINYMSLFRWKQAGQF